MLPTKLQGFVDKIGDLVAKRNQLAQSERTPENKRKLLEYDGIITNTKIDYLYTRARATDDATFAD